jgi:hypothetical protein
MNKRTRWQILSVGVGLGIGTTLAVVSFVGWQTGLAAGSLVLGSACVFVGYFSSR